ncbi:MAG: hypothetical protein KF850_12050 [Labilithrix sp.]|nr:hypothetical protein [Labilithrix sp.]
MTNRGGGRLPHLLDEVEEAAAELARDPRPAEGQDAARRLLRAVYEVGLAAGTAPTAAGAEALEDAVRRTAPLLSRGCPALAYAVVLLESRFYGSWEWDWRRAAEARSALQFLLDLYRGTELEAGYEALGTGELDAQMRFRGERDGHLSPASIPEGIPTSHWWWWAPDEPPTTRSARGAP